MYRISLEDIPFTIIICQNKVTKANSPSWKAKIDSLETKLANKKKTTFSSLLTNPHAMCSKNNFSDSQIIMNQTQTLYLQKFFKN